MQTHMHKQLIKHMQKIINDRRLTKYGIRKTNVTKHRSNKTHKTNATTKLATIITTTKKYKHTKANKTK